MKYNLTKRETDVFKGMLTEKSYEEIAEDLGITLKTVKTHIGNIFLKTLTNSRSELISLELKDALDFGYVITDENIDDLNLIELKEFKFQLIGKIKRLQKLTRQIDDYVKDIYEKAS